MNLRLEAIKWDPPSLVHPQPDRLENSSRLHDLQRRLADAEVKVRLTSVRQHRWLTRFR